MTYCDLHITRTLKRNTFDSFLWLVVFSFLTAIYNFEGSNSFELKLSVGDTVQILEECSGKSREGALYTRGQYLNCLIEQV